MDEKPGWRIGWRNLGRNRRRTLITASGLALGYVAVVVMSGLAGGLVAEMVDNGTGILTGQVQVHSTEYLPDRSLYATIGGRDGVDVESLLRSVASAPEVAVLYDGIVPYRGTVTIAGRFQPVEQSQESRWPYPVTWRSPAAPN